MSGHVHSRARCAGTALLRYRTKDGRVVVWPIAASMCPERPSTEASLREHHRRHRPGCELLAVRLLTEAEWERACEDRAWTRDDWWSGPWPSTTPSSR